MDNDDRKRLAALINRWTWTFGLLAAADVLAPLVYWARLDAAPDRSPIPPVVAGILYISMAVATGLAYGGRSRAQWNLSMAGAEHARQTDATAHAAELAAIRADIAALAEAMTAHEENRDRRDGLAYAAISRVDMRQRHVHARVTELVERERDTGPIPQIRVVASAPVLRPATPGALYAQGYIDGVTGRPADAKIIPIERGHNNPA